MIVSRNIRTVLVYITTLLLFLIYTTEHYSGRKNTYNSLISELSVEDSTPYIEYRKMKAKTDLQDSWQRQRIGFFGDGFGIGPLKLWKTEECDTCQSFKIQEKSSEKYYFGLAGFYLKDGVSANDFFEKQHYYVAKHNIRFKFNIDEPHEPGELLISTTKTNYNILMVVAYILAGIGIIAFLLILRPVHVLMNIANGKAFIEENYRMLRLSGLIIIGYLLLSIVFEICILEIYRGSVPAELDYPFWQNLYEKRKSFVVGIALLLLAAAFKKGYELKEEQSLTV